MWLRNESWNMAPMFDHLKYVPTSRMVGYEPHYRVIFVDRSCMSDDNDQFKYSELSVAARNACFIIPAGQVIVQLINNTYL